jgi:hypothetical protein
MQVGPALAMLHQVKGRAGFTEWLQDVVSSGESRLTVRHEWMIRQYCRVWGVLDHDGGEVPF